jgi:hypothetical protein
MPRSRTRPKFRIAAVAVSIVAIGVIAGPWFGVGQTAKRIAESSYSGPEVAFAEEFGVTSTTLVPICDRRAASTAGARSVPSAPPLCLLRVRLEETIAVGALQFRLDYSASLIEFTEDGGSDANCTPLIGDFSAFNLLDDERALDGAIIDIEGFDGPVDLAECEFIPDPCAAFPIDGLPEGVTLTPTDASTPDLTPISPLPALSASTLCQVSTTTTTLPPGACGAPITGLVPPVTTDVLRILRTAIGLDACADCRCDVDSNGSVDARDARRALLASLGLGDGLSCPGC